jgi:single-strand DNA-binding protein
MNNWNFIGNIGNVRDLKYTPAGKAVFSFSVAVKSGWGDNEKTSWANCTLWGNQAEKLSQYIHKGDRIGISGELTLREYESDKGKGVSLDVYVKDVTLLGDKRNKTTDESAEYGGDFDDNDFVDF